MLIEYAALGYLLFGFIVGGMFWAAREVDFRNHREFYAALSPRAQLAWYTLFISIMWPAFLALLIGWAIMQIRMPKFDDEDTST